MDKFEVGINIRCYLTFNTEAESESKAIEKIIQNELFTKYISPVDIHEITVRKERK